MVSDRSSPLPMLGVRTKLSNKHQEWMFFTETPEEPFLQRKQQQLKKARLGQDLNEKLAHRPGPMELIHKNILPAPFRIKQVVTGKSQLVIDKGL